MNASNFDHILRKVVVVPVGALLVGAALFAWQMKIANSTVSEIELNDNRLRQTLLIEKLIIDEEAGLRGYELTHDSQMLGIYYQAKEALPGAFAARRSMAIGARTHTINDIEASQVTWEQAFAAPLIEAIRSGGHTDDVALNLNGKQMMDQIRIQIEGLNTLTYQKRAEAIDQWHHQVRAMLGTVIAFAIVAGLILGLYVRRLIEKISTAFRQSHEVLRFRAEQTFQSEEKLRATLRSIGEGVITCDAAGLVQTMNDAAQTLTGWKEEEARDQELDVVLPLFDETSSEPVVIAARKILQSDSRSTLNHQSLVRRRDGVELFIEENGSPLRDKHGALAGVVIVVRDVTLQRKSQLALMANEKLAVAGRLAASIAHEIHNPLDSVSNLLYLMDGVATDEEREHFVRLAKQEIDRVTQISRAMLSLYRESRSPVSINIGETLASVLLLMESRFRALEVEVTQELPPSLCVEGFPAELRQVFTNLLTNAAEAAGAGGHVALRASQVDAAPQEKHPTGSGILITVSDDGPGIPEETIPKLFQPFFTTKGERGTGLGLWISRGIVSKHGGLISLTSTVGTENHGTVVSVFLANHPTMTVEPGV